MADIEINKSDIDEVNDVIQETDEEAYALDSEFTEEKEYKTVQKYELVTILSYLIGVRNEILDHMCSDEYVELLNSLRENKNASVGVSPPIYRALFSSTLSAPFSYAVFTSEKLPQQISSIGFIILSHSFR